ncbi:MAG: pyridoxal phosphate-dependent aminotransferase [Fervidobacterium sp.]
MVSMFHGGDIYSVGKDVIDFSSNINPLGPIEGLEKYLFENFKDVKVYPDIQYRKLKSNVANYLNVKPEEVIVGNGAMEILNNLILMFDKIVTFIPCFSEYVLRPKIYNKELVTIEMSKEFEIKSKYLECLCKNLSGGELIILGNPNNPTGRKIEKETLLEIAALTLKKGSFLFLDETFHEFTEGYNSIELLKDFKNIIILRAATKFFALPGIRLGYAYASEEFVNIYSTYELPWSVNTFAELASDIIFNQQYIEKSKEYIKEQRIYVLKRLKEINNLVPHETDCNFILIKLNKYNESYVYEKMLEKDILIRKCSTFPGLDNKYIRVAIRKKAENDLLLESLEEIMNS